MSNVLYIQRGVWGYTDLHNVISVRCFRPFQPAGSSCGPGGGACPAGAPPPPPPLLSPFTTECTNKCQTKFTTSHTKKSEKFSNPWKCYTYSRLDGITVSLFLKGMLSSLDCQYFHHFVVREWWCKRPTLPSSSKWAASRRPSPCRVQTPRQAPSPPPFSKSLSPPPPWCFISPFHPEIFISLSPVMLSPSPPATPVNFLYFQLCQTFMLEDFCNPFWKAMIVVIE